MNEYKMKKELNAVYAEIGKHEKEVMQHNSQLLIENGLSWDNLNEVMEDDGCELTGKIEVVSKPRGDNQHEAIGIFKQTYVDQWTTGMEGDSFSGFIYAKIDKNKWLKIPYSC